MQTSDDARFYARLSFFIYILILLLLSLIVLGAFIRTGINGYGRAMFNDQVSGTAYKPFVYRALVPFLIRTISSTIPQSTKIELDRWVRKNCNKQTVQQVLSGINFTDFAIAGCILYLSIIGFAWVFMYFIQTFYTTNSQYLYLLSLIGVAGLPAFFKYYSYLYDFTHLFLFTLGLTLLARAKWIPYLFVLTITTVSKETSLLLIFVYFLVYRTLLARPSFILLSIAQVFLYVIIRVLLLFTFKYNPGSVVEFHLGYNLHLEPYPISQFVALVIIGIAITYDWANKPIFLRYSLLILVPLLLMSLIFGFLDEYRGYYEVYPIILLLIAHTITRILSVCSFEVKSLYKA